MTKREIINRYFPQMILIMADPTKAIKFCEPYSEGLTMGNLIDNLPDKMVPGLFNIIKTSKYKEDPKSILYALKKELREATE